MANAWYCPDCRSEDGHADSGKMDDPNLDNHSGHGVKFVNDARECEKCESILIDFQKCCGETRLIK